MAVNPDVQALAATVRSPLTMMVAVLNDEACADALAALAALVARCEELEAIREKFEHLSSEYALDHDRGDHLVYRHEWEAFRAWSEGQRDLESRLAEVERERDEYRHAADAEAELADTFREALLSEKRAYSAAEARADKLEAALKLLATHKGGAGWIAQKALADAGGTEGT